MKNFLNCWELLKLTCLYGTKVETSSGMVYEVILSTFTMDNQQLILVLKSISSTTMNKLELFLECKRLTFEIGSVSTQEDLEMKI